MEIKLEIGIGEEFIFKGKKYRCELAPRFKSHCIDCELNKISTGTCCGFADLFSCGERSDGAYVQFVEPTAKPVINVDSILKLAERREK